MKITTIAITLIGLIAAGCSHDKYASYDSSRNGSYTSQTFESTTSPSTSTSQSYQSTTPSSTSQSTTSSSLSSSQTASPSTSTSQSLQSSTITSPTGSDTTLVTEVRKTISNDPTLVAIAPQIQVNAANGAVTLSGTVKSEQEKEKIAEVVRQTTGVVSVNNQLSVSLSPTSERQESKVFPDTSSTSDTSKSDLTSKSELSPTTPGSATSTAEKSESSSLSKTETLYRNSPNSQPTSPTSERSETRIYSSKTDTSATQPGATTTEQSKSSSTFDVNIQSTTEADRTLGQKIMQELKTDTSLAAAIPMVKISLSNGKVTLKGTVKSDAEKQKIESVVQRVTGVSSVDNQLQVGAKATTDTATQPATSDTKPE